MPRSPMQFTFPVMASSRDGRTVVIGRTVRAGRDQALQVLAWRSDRPDKFEEILTPSEVNASTKGRNRSPRAEAPPNLRAMALGAKGERIYLVDANGRLMAWAIDGAGSKARSLGWANPPEDAFGLALSPDGSVLAVGRKTGVVTLFDTSTGKIRADLKPSPSDGEGFVWSLAFSPDGKYLAVGTQQGKVDFWSLAETSFPLVRLPSHRGFVTALAFDAEGKHLASAGSDKNVDVWDLERVREDLGRLGLDW